jgi:hypothetical protein
MNDNKLKINLSAIRIKCAEIVGWTYIEQLAFTGIPKGSRGNADARVIPNYPESADAALQLVEWMSKPENGGFGFSTTRSQKDGSWEVFFEHASWDAHCADAETFQLAVCLAFLKANNIEPKTL